MTPRLPTLLLACLAVVLLVRAAACADQTEEADRIIDKASALIDETDVRYGQVMDLWYKVAEIDPASPTAPGALPMLSEMAAGVEEITPRLMSIVALYDEAVALDVSPELKVWLGQQKEVSPLRIHELWLIGDTTAKLQSLYDEWDRFSDAERNELLRHIDENYTEERGNISLAKEKQAASDQYYAERLGETSEGSADTWIDVFVFLAIGVVGGAIGRWIRGRRRRQGGAELLGEDSDMSWEE